MSFFSVGFTEKERERERERDRSTFCSKALGSYTRIAGLFRRITRPTFQVFGIFALFTERFTLSVMYLSATGHRLCN